MNMNKHAWHRINGALTSSSSPLMLVGVLIATILGSGCAGFDGAQLSQRLDPTQVAASSVLGTGTLSPSQWGFVDWWKRYGDQQLNLLVSESQTNNASLRIAMARVRYARALSGLAQAVQGPQLNANLKDSRQHYSEHSTYPMPLGGSWDWVNEGTLNLGYEFDLWGKNQALADAAIGRLRASEVDAQAARILLSANIVHIYLNLTNACIHLELTTDALQLQEAMLKLTQQRIVAKIDSDVELKQAESALFSSRLKLAGLQGSIESDRNQLAALVGKGPERAAKIVRPKLDIEQGSLLPTAVPVDLIGRRPDVLAQRWRVEAASKETRAAQAQFYPNVSLIGYLGSQTLGFGQFLNSGSNIAGIGPALNLPIFDAGRLRSNLGARNAEFDIALEQYNQTIVEAVQDVVNQLSALQWLDMQHREQERALQTAQQAYELALQRYRAGLVSYLQVLTTQLQLLNAKELLAELQLKAMQLDSSLIRSLGGFVPESLANHLSEQ
jgi:NodT family efflux transporter outer membrane factor (OMF) lipoprotein